jgi:3-carboxy-cis,cis-muconate cycloisomerase
MRANLDATRGLIYAESVSMALARSIGRTAAHQLVEHACRRAQEERRPLQGVALDDAAITQHLSPAALKSLFDPQPHVRAAARLVDQALAVAAGCLRKE